MNSVKITLSRSPIGCPWQQKRTARALGFTKLGQCVVRPDNAQIRGMIKTIVHLVTVEELEDTAVSQA